MGMLWRCVIFTHRWGPWVRVSTGHHVKSDPFCVVYSGGHADMGAVCSVCNVTEVRRCVRRGCEGIEHRDLVSM